MVEKGGGASGRDELLCGWLNLLCFELQLLQHAEVFDGGGRGVGCDRGGGGLFVNGRRGLGIALVNCGGRGGRGGGGGCGGEKGMTGGGGGRG
jgi:hypothetical protein